MVFLPGSRDYVAVQIPWEFYLLVVVVLGVIRLWEVAKATWTSRLPACIFERASALGGRSRATNQARVDGISGVAEQGARYVIAGRSGKVPGVSDEVQCSEEHETKDGTQRSSPSIGPQGHSSFSSKERRPR